MLERFERASRRNVLNEILSELTNYLSLSKNGSAIRTLGATCYKLLLMKFPV